MPVYVYRCGVCGRTEEQVRSINKRDDLRDCSACSDNRRPGTLFRDAVASMLPHSDAGFHKPLLSRSLGVPPEQIAEAKAQFPDHEFAPDGRMIIRSATEYDRVQKDLGLE